MRALRSDVVLGLLLVLAAGWVAPPVAAAAPQLRKQGEATQLIVDGKPFLILGGELGNSTASSLEYLQPYWKTLSAENLNTVVVTVSWEIIEPVEGRFDFSSVDGLIRGARAHDMRLVLLWFGSWKNSMSSYVPAWVKRDQARFARVLLPAGNGTEILSALSANNLDADARAFRALMAHLKAVDADRNTVLMVQVENEVGMLPAPRDYSVESSKRFAAAVPPELLQYLVAKRASLVPQLRELWEANGAKPEGSWQELFGQSQAAEEVFTAWYFARYVDAVAAAGKAAYPLPMYANVALNRPGKLPGEYPSGGPLPHLIDVWKAGAPSIDFLSPDIYFPNFVELVGKYARPDNPLFIPEANRAGQAASAADALFAFGRHDAIGFSPFAIETIQDPKNDRLSQAYALLRELAPLIQENQGRHRLMGLRPPVSYDGTIDDSPQTFTLGDYRFTATFVDSWTAKSEQQTATHGGLVVQVGPEEYLVAGSGIALEFVSLDPDKPLAGIDSDWEGHFIAGRWVPGRLLNGDETHQGRRLKMPRERFGIQRLKLYRYR